MTIRERHKDSQPSFDAKKPSVNTTCLSWRANMILGTGVRGINAEWFKCTFIEITIMVLMASGDIFTRGCFHGNSF